MVSDNDRRLGEALAAAGYPPSIVQQAREGRWSDFKSNIPFPKINLVKMLEMDGHQALAKRVVEGEFDG